MKRKLMGAFVAAGLILALAACGNSDSNSDSAGDSIPLRIANQPYATGLPIHLADKLGFYKKKGLSVTIDSFATGALASEAGVAGRWDVGFMGATPAISGGAKWGLKIISPYVEEGGAIALYARQGIDESNAKTALQKKAVFYTSNSTGHLVLTACLAKLGINPKDIELTSASPEALVSGFIAGNGEAAATWPPNTYALAKDGATVLCDGKSAGVRIDDPLIATPKIFKSNPTAVKKFIAATLEANQWIVQNPEKAVEELLAFYKKLGVAVTPADAKLEISTRSWIAADEAVQVADSGTMLDSMQKTAEFAVSTGQYPNVPDLKSFVDLSLIEK